MDDGRSEQEKHAALMNLGMVAFMTGKYDQYIKKRFDEAETNLESLYDELDDSGTTSEKSAQAGG